MSADTERNPLYSVEIFDPETLNWSSGPKLPQSRFGAVMVQYGADEVGVRMTRDLLHNTFFYVI